MMRLALSAIVCWAAMGAGGSSVALAAEADRPLVLTVDLEDEVINPGTARYLKRSIQEAEEQGAECLVVRLDTPGGLLQSTKEMVQEILVSRVCVVVYVSPSGGRAASAGLFVTLAAHVAAMAPGTRIGAAHPVRIGGLPFSPPGQPDIPGIEGQSDRQDPSKAEENEQGKEKSGRGEPPGSSGSAVEAKLVNDTVAWAKALAQRHGRNAQWAAKAVSESATLTAEEAVAQGVVDLLAADLDELLEKLDGRQVTIGQGSAAAERTLRTQDAVVREVSMWWGERVLAILSQPNVAFLLLIFGFYGILFELHSPGWGVSGTLGLICLLLSFFGLAVLPVDYLGLALILTALGLFVAEAFVTSFGALTVAGLVCLVLGGLMLVDSPAGFSRVSLAAVLPVAAATAVIVVFLMAGVVRVHLRRARTGDDALVGCQAVVREALARRGDHYEGTVFVHGEWWQATSDVPLAAGQRCVIQSRDGLRVYVAPCPPPRENESVKR